MFSRIRTHLNLDIHYIVKSSFWILIGKLMVLSLSAFALYVFGNYAPKDTFGTYSYILSMVALANIATLPGMIPALVRAIAQGSEGTLLHMAKLRMYWSVLGFIGLSIISIWYFSHENSSLGLSFAIVAVLLPFASTLDELVFRFWQGKERFDRSALLSILYQISISGALITALLVTDNIVFIIGAFFSASAISAVSLFYFTQHITVNRHIDTDSTRLGFHLTAIQGMGVLANNFDKVLIWHLLGPIALATYSLAQMPILKVWQSIPVQTLALPKLSKKTFDKSLKRKLLRHVAILFLLIVPLMLFLLLMAPIIFRTLLPAYLSSVPYFQALTFSLLFLPFLLLDTSFTASLQTRELYIIRLLTSVGKIISLIILLPLFGLWGAVYAVIIGYALQAGTSVMLFVRTKPSQTTLPPKDQ